MELPERVLDSYGLKHNMLGSGLNYWLIENDDKKIEIRRYEGECFNLQEALKWQKYLALRSNTIVPELVETRDNKDFVDFNENLFYATRWVKKDEFKPEDITCLQYAGIGLGILHRLSNEYKMSQIKSTVELLSPSKIQDGLTQLIKYYNEFKQRRSCSDFERIYLENFSFIYDQGQEALQKIVMVGYEAKLQENTQMLLNSFIKNKLAIVNEKLMFTDLCGWTLGTKTMDLSLFINSYLPLHKWDVVLLKQFLYSYEQENGLDQQDRQLLMAQLRFPYRFWFYAYQFDKKLQNIEVLVKKLKLYVSESHMRDSCLDKMESWLWREENENSDR